MIKSSAEQIEALKAFMGPMRDVYPKWYIDFLMDPWVEFFVPEITWHYDEIVENQIFCHLIQTKYGIKSEILMIGSNRKGRQAFIKDGDHDYIHLIDIENHSKFDYHDTEIHELPAYYKSVHWRIFKEEVMQRPPRGRFD